jgi:hypothetical protein
MANLGNSFANVVSNQKIQAINLFLEKLIGKKIGLHQEVVQRLAVQLVTEKDLQQLAMLCNELYQEGYIKCFDHYREKLAVSGVKIKIED